MTATTIRIGWNGKSVHLREGGDDRTLCGRRAAQDDVSVRPTPESANCARCIAKGRRVKMNARRHFTPREIELALRALGEAALMDVFDRDADPADVCESVSDEMIRVAEKCAELVADGEL